MRVYNSIRNEYNVCYDLDPAASVPKYATLEEGWSGEYSNDRHQCWQHQQDRRIANQQDQRAAKVKSRTSSPRHRGP